MNSEARRSQIGAAIAISGRAAQSNVPPLHRVTSPLFESCFAYFSPNIKQANVFATRAEVLCSRARRVRIHLTRCLQLRTRAKGSLVRVTCISTWLGEHQRLCKRSKRADNKLDKEKRNVRFEPRADRDLIKST